MSVQRRALPRRGVHPFDDLFMGSGYQRDKNYGVLSFPPEAAVHLIGRRRDGQAPVSAGGLRIRFPSGINMRKCAAYCAADGDHLEAHLGCTLRM